MRKIVQTVYYNATQEKSLQACELYDIYVWRMTWVVSDEHALIFLS